MCSGKSPDNNPRDFIRNAFETLGRYLVCHLDNKTNTNQN